jgi:hypothetical protein
MMRLEVPRYRISRSIVRSQLTTERRSPGLDPQNLSAREALTAKQDFAV